MRECPRGHELTRWRTRVSTLRCDGACGLALVEGGWRYSCTVCDYDVCEGCTKVVKSPCSRSTGEAAAENEVSCGASVLCGMIMQSPAAALQVAPLAKADAKRKAAAKKTAAKKAAAARARGGAAGADKAAAPADEGATVAGDGAPAATREPPVKAQAHAATGGAVAASGDGLVVRTADASRAPTPAEAEPTMASDVRAPLPDDPPATAAPAAEPVAPPAAPAAAPAAAPPVGANPPLYDEAGNLLCGKDGCTRLAWHTGLCTVVLASRRAKVAPKLYEAEAAPNPRELIKRARAEGRLPAPPAKKPPPPPPPPPAAKKRGGGAEGGAEPEQKRLGLRTGTRSHGGPTWLREGPADESEQRSGAVRAAIEMGGGGAVVLRLSVLPVRKAVAVPPQLRDFLAKGLHDRAANEAATSKAIEKLSQIEGRRGVEWGCLCRGSVGKGGAELKCRRCALTFHAKCERLDFTAAELRVMAEKGSFVCADCEQLELLNAGP